MPEGQAPRELAPLRAPRCRNRSELKQLRLPLMPVYQERREATKRHRLRAPRRGV